MKLSRLNSFLGGSNDAMVDFYARLAVPFAWATLVVVGSFLVAVVLIQLLGGLEAAVAERYWGLLAFQMVLGIFTYFFFRVAAVCAKLGRRDALCPPEVGDVGRRPLWQRLLWHFLAPVVWPDYLFVFGLVAFVFGFSDAWLGILGWVLFAGLVGACLVAVCHLVSDRWSTQLWCRVARVSPRLSGLLQMR